jgi:hypothetical protein
MLRWIRGFAGLLVAMTGGYIVLVGEAGLNPANHNLCDLYKSITGLPFASCKSEFLILTIWKFAVIAAVLYLFFEAFRWVKKPKEHKDILPFPSPPSASSLPQPNMSLREAVEHVVGTAKWLGSGEGIVTKMADFIESLPQHAVLERIQSWGRKNGIGKVQSPLVPIEPLYWADHVFDLVEFYRSGLGVSRHVLSSDHSPQNDFSDIHFDTHQIAKLPRTEIEEGQPGPHPLKVEVGTSIDFYDLVRDRPRIHSLMKLFKIRVENKERSKAISGIRVSITAVSKMTSGFRFPWVLADDLQISAGDHEMIPFAKYEEWREPEKQPSPAASDTIEIVVPQSDRFRLLPIEEEHTLQVRCTGADAPPADATIKLSVVSGRLQIEKV